PEPRGIDDCRGAQHKALASGVYAGDPVAVAERLNSTHGRPVDELSAVLARALREVGHQAVGIHDAGGRNIERRWRAHLWLQALDLSAADHTQAFDAVTLGGRLERIKSGHLTLVDGDYKLAGVAVGHGVPRADRVEHPVAGHAEARFKRARGVLETGVD